MSITHDKPIFKIQVCDVQLAAQERIGRVLTDDELDIVSKCLEWGLLETIDTVYTAAIGAAIGWSKSHNNLA